MGRNEECSGTDSVHHAKRNSQSFRCHQQAHQSREGDNCPTMQEVEMMRKLLNMSATIDKFHTGAYIEAFEELTTYIFHQDVDLARKVTTHADNYIKGHLGNENEEFDRHQAENVARVEKNLENDPEVSGPTLPPDTLPETLPTDLSQTETPQPIEPTPTQPDTQIVAPEENNTSIQIPVTTSPTDGMGETNESRIGNNTLPSVPIISLPNEALGEDNQALVGFNTLSFAEGRGEANEALVEANEIKCDKNGIMPPTDNNSDNQLIYNKVDHPTTATQYLISNFSKNVITTRQWQNRSLIDHPANEVLGKG